MKALVKTAHRQGKAKVVNAFDRLASKKPITRGAHIAARAAFEAMGFKFETRVQGDLKLGLIRLTFKKSRFNKKSLGRKIKRAVFVPGFGDTPLSWLPILGPLRPVFSTQVDELIILDFPGFGGFLQDEPAFDCMGSLQTFFCDVMRSLEPEVLMGHSLGGWLATDYVVKTTADKQPKQMILIDPSGVLGSDSQRLAFQELFETATVEGFSSLRKHIFKKEPIWFSWLAYEFGNFIQRPEIQSFVRSIEDAHLVENRLGNISCDTWVVWGDHDTMTPTDWIKDWMNSLRHVKSHGVLIKNSGHSPHVEKPAVTLALLTQILLGFKPVSLLGRPFWKVIDHSIV
jgi:pimeloyl-ACP methyl ester carboxylesterase